MLKRLVRAFEELYAVALKVIAQVSEGVQWIVGEAGIVTQIWLS